MHFKLHSMHSNYMYVCFSVGHVVRLTAVVNRAFSSSLEVSRGNGPVLTMTDAINVPCTVGRDNGGERRPPIW